MQNNFWKIEKNKNRPKPANFTKGGNMNSHGPIAIVDISDDKKFSTNVAKMLGIQPHITKVSKFADGETKTKIEQSVRGKDVYLFVTYQPPVGEHFYELMNAAIACQSGGKAARLNVVMNYCYGMRGERITAPRESAQAVVVARALYAMGVDQILTIGLHNEAVQSIFQAVGEKGGIPLEHLSFEPIAGNYTADVILKEKIKLATMASPDVGGTKRVEKARTIVEKTYNLPIELAIVYKARTGDDQIEVMKVIGDLRDRTVFIYDDIGGTLKTIRSGVDAMKESGAKEIYIIEIHPVLSKGFETELEKLCNDDVVKEIVFGNTIPLKGLAITHPKVKTKPLEPLVSEAIQRMNLDHSMSELHNPQEIRKIYEKWNLMSNPKYV